MNPAGSATASASTSPSTYVPDAGTPCTLCLYCDLSQSSAQGLFASNSTANPSKVWKITVNNQSTIIKDDDLVLPKNGNNLVQVQVTFNLNGGTFTDMGMAGPTLDLSELLTSAALRLTIIVARNRRNKGSTSTFASPFAMGQNNNLACTVFDGVVPAATLNNANAPSVLLPIGTPALNSGSPAGNRDSYLMLVAVTGNVTTAAQTNLFFTDSHDPEMEIGM